MARLRELILTLAVQGKLVPQDPGDEPASALLKKIRTEKDRLIAMGKIKRDKSLAEITEEEKPFGLPASWALVRVNELLPEFQNGASSRGDVGGKSVTVLRLADIKKRRISLADTRQIPIAESDILKYQVQVGDILITRVNGSADIVGQFNLCDTAVDAIYCDHFIRMRVSNQWIEPTYLALVSESSLMRRRIKELFITTAGQKTVNQGHIGSLQFGLPPFAEQTRIVARVEELMHLCDALEAKGQLEAAQHAQLVSTLLGTLTDSDSPAQLAENWQRVASHFDLLLDRPQAVDALEQTILQLAVRGLLVPQDPQDEPASALLQKIRQEKDRLIAQGQIKRDKPLPPISEDEQPFALPPGWEWVRMGDVLDGGSGTTPLRARTDYFADGTEMWVKTTDLTNGKVTTCDELITKAAVVENRLKYFPAGTVCVAMYGGAGTIGKSGVLGVSSTINQSVFALPPTEGIDVGFLHTYVITVRSQWMSFAAGLRKDPNINGQIIKKMVMPLPPLAEQSRIVTRVAALRQLCADLRERLSASQSTQAQLAEALVQEVA
ncbi:MAG: hypothetical protein BWK72_16935 [Rhodoferax ferrireducens]|uniref:Type I restriction modification DNA specificity domain-containing protein n=1 Tax=Rhodoferax ferrireducens TaxID=192843 RepID=A0A1W9KQR8_9BURK|nr:MAG: hypothetical protein BWK72_16935 [Rhodoferax ferrireducens]